MEEKEMKQKQVQKIERKIGWKNQQKKWKGKERD